MNIYVGNLSYDVGENELRQAFEEHGSVDTVKVVMDKYTGRSKGFGFVEMPSDDEAKAAIAGLDGKDLMGRAIKVNVARPLEERSRPSW